jgi:hypothetical protein
MVEWVRLDNDISGWKHHDRRRSILYLEGNRYSVLYKRTNFVVSIILAISGVQAGPSLIVAMPDDSNTLFRSPVSPCHSKVDVRSDGSYYLSDNTGSYGAAEGVWLIRGSSGNVWVERTVVGDTLDVDEIGAGRVQLSSDREFGYENSNSPTTDSCVVTLDFYDASSGGNLLDTADLTISAQFDDGA